MQYQPTNQLRINILDVFRADVKVRTLQGQVIDIRRNNKTHISTSGGYASASAGRGYVSASVTPVRISSTSSVHDDVYLRLATGEETAIKLVNWDDMPMRPGHEIKVAWLYSVDGSKSTPILAVENISLNKRMFENYSHKKSDYVEPFMEKIKFFDVKKKFDAQLKIFKLLSPIGRILTVGLGLIPVYIFKQAAYFWINGFVDWLIATFIFLCLCFVWLFFSVLLNISYYVLYMVDSLTGAKVDKAVVAESKRIRDFIAETM